MISKRLWIALLILILSSIGVRCASIGSRNQSGEENEIEGDDGIGNVIPTKYVEESTTRPTLGMLETDDVDGSGTDTNIDYNKDTTNTTGSLENEQDVDDSGENDATAMIPITQSRPVVDSNEDTLNISDSSSEYNSNEVNSTAERMSISTAASIDIASNSLTEVNSTADQEICLLKKKIKSWQKAVDNYIQSGQQRRKRDQSALVPSNGGTSTGKAPSSAMTVAGQAIGDALKPAMDLMNQGVDLLNDLYSTRLTRSDVTAPDSNNTLAIDQFRDQMKQLQTKLSDVGQQLQRVVSSFQQLQVVPFLDSVMAADVFASDSRSG